ncbi:hypothetical protein DL93DRAFT_2079353 [Clavulina sp. PMI_390]|nr:hypothetical protein DL93DRAFT_2079353 [Clavulina sp. PMI_390]
MSELVGFLARPLFVAALALPTTRLVRLGLFGVIAVIEWHNFTSILVEPGIHGFVTYGQASGGFLAALSPYYLLVLMKDPRGSTKWVAPSGSAEVTKGQDKEKTSQLLFDDNRSLFSRIWAAYDLSYNSRYVKTTHQSANITPLPPHLLSSRTKFCFNRLLHTIRSIFIVAVIYFVASHDEHFPSVRQALITPSPTFLQRAIATVGVLTFLLNLMTAGHCFLAIGTVVTRVSEPADWPDFFGRFEDVYTLRRAWGQGWHQALRRPLGTSANIVVEALHIPHQTLLSRFVKLVVSFGISSIGHAWGDFSIYHNSLPPHLRSNVRAHFSLDALFSPQFFMSQVVGIMAESIVIDVAKLLLATKSTSTKAQGGDGEEATFSPGMETLGRMFGRTWVFVWFCATFPQFQQKAMVWVFRR